jgi:hypothetical protein
MTFNAKDAKKYAMVVKRTALRALRGVIAPFALKPF